MTCPYAAQKYKKRKTTKPKAKKYYKKKSKKTSKSSKKRKVIKKVKRSYPTSLSRYTKSCSMMSLSDLKKSKCYKKLKNKRSLKDNLSVCRAIIKSCPTSWRLGMGGQPKAVKKLVKAIKKAKKTKKPVVINSPVKNLHEPNKLFYGPCRENEVRDAYSGKCVIIAKPGTTAIEVFSKYFPKKGKKIKDVSAPEKLKAITPPAADSNKYSCNYDKYGKELSEPVFTTFAECKRRLQTHESLKKIASQKK